VFARIKKSGRHEYLQIVQNQRIDGKSRQQVIGTIGRLDQLHESGDLDGLMGSLAKFAQHIAVIDAVRSDQVQPSITRHVGPALVFEKLWEQIGMPKLLQSLLRDRKFEFPVERAIFVTVLHRLMVSGSDRAAEQWCRNQAINGIDEIQLHHLYRAMGWLGEALPVDEAKLKGLSSPDVELNVLSAAPRTRKDVIEEQLFARRRSLFTDVEMVFFDTTSIYFEGEGGEEIGQRGYSKDHRPDLNQMIVGVVLDNQGRPICSELLPGNTTDIKTLLPVIDRLRHRFGITKICVVSDRGMISEQVVDDLVARKLQFILGARLRNVKEIREDVLSDTGAYLEVNPARQKHHDPSPLKIKDVHVNTLRYVVCHNEEQAAKDRHDREAIIAGLKDQLQGGVKSLVGNKGYRKYLREKTKGTFDVDSAKVESESRFDGKWVLRTNVDDKELNAEEVACKYKDLLVVEALFRNMKSVLDTRPIYHKCDETIRGHVFCSFLALILMKELKSKLAERGWTAEWSRLMEDLNELQELTLEVSGTRFILRTPTQGAAGKAIQAVSAALGQVIRQI
jgi:transposase